MEDLICLTEIGYSCRSVHWDVCDMVRDKVGDEGGTANRGGRAAEDSCKVGKVLIVRGLGKVPDKVNHIWPKYV